MLILEDDMLKSEDEKLKYLIKHADSEDLLTHNWYVLKSNGQELCLICSICSYVYGVVVYNSGLKSRLFLPTAHARESVSVVSCKSALMNKALR